MTSPTPQHISVLRKYCAAIGLDPLLVQGAGGNVSLKEEDTLWIKASGTCLSNACTQEIFIPVDLNDLRRQIASKNFAAIPKSTNDTSLKPSIETMFHALMPHRLVLHLHAVDILVHLVRKDCNEFLNNVLDSSISFSIVGYCKPGANLASAISNALEQSPLTDVVFLRNHGIVIGGDSVADVDEKLTKIIQCLANYSSPVQLLPSLPPPNLSFIPDFYSPVNDPFIHQLATNPKLFSRLSSHWALYPDHVVFLGARPYIFTSLASLEQHALTAKTLPELIFLSGMGVYVQSSFTETREAQLRCYLDVLLRQSGDTELCVLSDTHVDELLNWDAEQYRLSLSLP